MYPTTEHGRFRPIADFRICDDVAAVNRLGILAYGIAVAVIALLTAREVIPAGAHLYEIHTSGMVALGVFGWFIATFGPLILSVCFWQMAQRAGRQWVWHLIFVPIAITIYQAGASILFYAAGVPDGDSVEGYTLIAGDGLLLFTLLVHAVALVAQGVAIVSGKAAVR